MNFPDFVRVPAGLPGSMFWTIIDTAQVNHLVTDGCEVGLGVYVRTGEKLVNLPAELEAVCMKALAFSPDDRYATAAFAMGNQGIRFIEQLDGFEGYMIDPRGIATVTGGFRKYESA